MPKPKTPKSTFNIHNKVENEITPPQKRIGDGAKLKTATKSWSHENGRCR